eukprot:TRINITY_DN88512_c0_g1_i1.p1 TRINITY_DN88512_c0_g1~~TRINITY_DN88512_c0_g1_i1.p1  ORF type:complete len:261 (-),score=36.48 TRINITY_DN88512_c0_g1_i1:103-885(-)
MEGLAAIQEEPGPGMQTNVERNGASQTERDILLQGSRISSKASHQEGAEVISVGVQGSPSEVTDSCPDPDGAESDSGRSGRSLKSCANSSAASQSSSDVADPEFFASARRAPDDLLTADSIPQTDIPTYGDELVFCTNSTSTAGGSAWDRTAGSLLPRTGDANPALRSRPLHENSEWTTGEPVNGSGNAESAVLLPRPLPDRLAGRSHQTDVPPSLNRLDIGELPTNAEVFRHIADLGQPSENSDNGVRSWESQSFLAPG